MKFFSYKNLLALCITMCSPMQAGLRDDVLRYLAEKTFFTRYALSSITDSSPARKKHPIKIPTNLPTPEELANTLCNRTNPSPFLCGASTSEHQCSKQCNPEICSWSRFAAGDNPLERALPQPTDPEYTIDWWHHYADYITYAKNELHLNALRFSIEWPLVQPNGPHSCDRNVLDHYADIFITMVKQGITPVVCLHHYTDPCWFLDSGGFEDKENIPHFATYCTMVYAHIMERVVRNEEALQALQHLPQAPLWATYNAPEGYGFRGYFQKQGPPSKPGHMGLDIVTKVLKNILESHVEAYHRINATYHTRFNRPDIPRPLIGFLKNIHQLDPATETWSQYLSSPFTRFMCAIVDMIQNGSIYTFFTTGEFRIHIPFTVNIQEVNPRAVGTLDFIGLNYYANRHMFFHQSIDPDQLESCKEKCSDAPMYYRYPQGMYRAIVELSTKLAKPLRIPLYVAENGIATTDDDKRYRFYHEYLYAITKAVNDGYRVYGYLPWTLATNYEWPALTDNKNRDYGLCSIDPNNPAQLILKEGARSYSKFARKMKELRLQNSSSL